MDVNNRLALSYYKTISTINDEHKIYLVQHIETQKIFVKKIINVYNKNVYEKIMTNPINGLPKIFNLIEDDGSLVVLEEYITGETLQDMIDNGHTFSDEEIIKYTYKLCDIVSQLHANTPAIIHRDIKPSNVILTPDGRIILLDLNAAKYYSASESQDTILLGTKGYAAPEQYGFGSSTIKTDIYAIGMLMVALISGEPLYSHKLNSSLDDIIANCTKINPAERYSSINQLQDELIKLIDANNYNFDGYYSVNRCDDFSKANSLAPKDYTLPGFRSKNPIHMAIAIIGYILIIYVSLEMKATSSLPSAFEGNILKLCSFCMCMMIVFGSCNYMDIWRFIPNCKSKNKTLKFLSIACLDFVLICIPFFIAVTILALFT